MILRVLVHDGGLLHQLDVINHLKYIDACEGGISGDEIFSTGGLFAFRFSSSGMEYLPRLASDLLKNAATPLIGFEPWWKSAVLKLANGRTYSRCNLILGLANRAGGAHVDYLRGHEYTLTHEGGLGLQACTLDSLDLAAVTDSPILPAVRTIAEEMMLSLHNQRILIENRYAASRPA